MRRVLGIAVVGMMGCGLEDALDGGDDTGAHTAATGGPGGPLTLDVAGWASDGSDFVDCTGAPTVALQVAADGEGLVAVYLEQTRSFGAFSAWNEVHTLDVIGGGGASVTYGRTLATGATPDTQTADASTLWICGTGAGSLDPAAGGDFQVGFVLALFGSAADVAADAPDDCVRFGHDPDQVLADTPGELAAQPAWVSTACRAL